MGGHLSSNVCAKATFVVAQLPSMNTHAKFGCGCVFDSAWALGMGDHLSSNVCAKAAFVAAQLPSMNTPAAAMVSDLLIAPLTRHFASLERQSPGKCSLVAGVGCPSEHSATPGMPLAQRLATASAA